MSILDDWLSNGKTEKAFHRRMQQKATVEGLPEEDLYNRGRNHALDKRNTRPLSNKPEYMRGWNSVRGNT